MAEKEVKVAKVGVEEGKLCAILAYLLVGIIWYFVDENMKKNEFAKFHAKQGLVLLIVSIAVSIANTFLWIIPIIGWLVITVLNIAIFILWILGIINAANGKQKELPVIGHFGKKFTF